MLRLYLLINHGKVMFKKIKSLWLKLKTPTAINKNTKNPSDKNHPVTTQIMAWLDGQNWKYDHRPPTDDSQTHHLVLGFTDNENDWTCVFRINENNQLVVMFGVLDDSVPASHHTAMLMEIVKTNLNINFGGIEFDPTDGEVRTKVAFDAEFVALSDKALGCYLQAVAGLTQIARDIIKTVLADDEPSQRISDYVEISDEIKAVVDDEKRTFFLPTHTAQ